MNDNPTYARWPLLLLVSTLTMVVGLSSAAAEDKEKEDFEDTIHVIQKKPVLEQQRLEIAPRFGMSVNDSVYRSFKAGANLNYHISERFYLGGLFEWYDFGSALGGPTKTFRKSFDQTSTAPDAPVINWVGALEGGFVPLYGKFALFNAAILYYDVGVTLGAGYLNSESLARPVASGGFGATGSVVGRLCLSDWMALNLNLRDILFPTKLQAGGGRTKSTIGNIVMVSAGVSLYFPTTFQYSDSEDNKK